ncbi:MAG: ATP-binding protein [Thiolinea sp.]
MARNPGIAESELERVFEPFTQLDHSRPAARSGVDMGLSVARSLLRAMGRG